MANISSSYGTITVEKEHFDVELQRLLEEAPVMNMYGIELLLESKSDDGSSIQYEFNGQGRWAMSSTLNWCFTESKAGQKLAKLMKEKDAVIEVDLFDYEPGSSFLVNDTGYLVPIFENGKWLMDFEYTEKEIEFSDLNKIKYEFEEGICMTYIKDKDLKSLMNDSYINTLFEDAEPLTKLSKEKFVEMVYEKIIYDPNLDGGVSEWRLDSWIEDINNFLLYELHYLDEILDTEVGHVLDKGKIETIEELIERPELMKKLVYLNQAKYFVLENYGTVILKERIDKYGFKKVFLAVSEAYEYLVDSFTNLEWNEEFKDRIEEELEEELTID